MPKYLWHLQQKCHDFCKKSLTPYHYIHITSHFAFFHTLLDFFNQSPRLLNIYNPALCVFALCAISLPPIYRKVRGLCVYYNFDRLSVKWNQILIPQEASRCLAPFRSQNRRFEATYICNTFSCIAGTRCAWSGIFFFMRQFLLPKWLIHFNDSSLKIIILAWLM